MIKLAPSILSADFSQLGSQLKIVEHSGANYAHIDVMDGHFVPNITIGIPVIESIRKGSNLIFDAHLMISEPGKYIEKFANAGADMINFHVEACKNHSAVINKIKSFGKKAAITVNPKTDIEKVYPFLEELDMVLIMSVEPGFGGQSFMKESLYKAEKLRSFVEKNKLPIDIEMDGGINLGNVRDVLNAGVNVVVAGSAIFSAANISAVCHEFIEIFEAYQ